MGYLQIATSTLADFDKAVFSLWFRISQATIDAVQALPDDPPGKLRDHMCNICFYPPMYKLIPLITFGSQEVSATDGLPISPCFIGVDCGGASVLAVNLQLANRIGGDIDVTEERAECFFMGGASSTESENTAIVADQWNFALISFDLSGGCSVSYPVTDPPTPFGLTSGATFSWALNDVNKDNGSILPSGGSNWSANGLSDPTSIIPQGLIEYVHIIDGTGSYSAAPVSSNGNPVGIPTSAEFVDNVYNIQMAEVQVFTGVTLDTSVESNRRAFIKADGTPANPALAQSLLGKRPDILLTGFKNFKAGTNSGTLGPFTKTGTLNSYSSRPKLGT